MKIIEMNKLILKRLKGRKFFVDNVIESLDRKHSIMFYRYICYDLRTGKEFEFILMHDTLDANKIYKIDKKGNNLISVKRGLTELEKEMLYIS